MAAKKESQMEKTNVMRILDQKKIAHGELSYEATGSFDGMEAAQKLGQDPKQVFKTLVTIAPSKQHYVFMVPVCMSLNLKAAAKAVSEKSIEMIKAKELLPLTGYVHGGCSPIGMKKQFTTVVDESAKAYDIIYFSAGKVGHQVSCAPADLEKVVRLSYAQVAEEQNDH